MDSGGDKEGDGSEGNSSGLHDHSDLLIPNPSFNTASAVTPMNISSPSSDLDLQKQMDCHMTSPQPVTLAGEHQQLNSMDFSNSNQPDSSPPNVIVDDSPLQPCIGRNKESLKVKLLMRRPMNQLVEQGILPPPKTPAAFAGQRVRLERARMGDLLKAKIQQRPARQELIRQHILEDTDSRVAPSLAEKQRMLKRARLADSLNDHLIHRPGPLELVQKNILHAPDADIEKAIKEGIVCFKATSEGHVPGPSLPNKYTCNEDDSSSDISSPAGTPDASSSGHTTEAGTPITKQPSDPSIVASDPCDVTLQPAKTNKSETAHLILATPVVTPKVIAPAPIQQTTVTAAVIPPPPPLPPSGLLNPPQTIVLSDGAVRELLPQLQSAGFQLATHVQNATSLVSATSKPSHQSSLGKSRSSKKSSKSKSQPKTRTIKFHEYKGPSNCQQKGGPSISLSSSPLSSLSTSNAESSYELLLKQQQLFLQWQLEWQHKYPQILLPAAPKVTLAGGTKTGNPSISMATTLMSSYPVTTIPASFCTNFINNQSSSQPIAVTTTINASPRPITVTLAPKTSNGLDITGSGNTTIAPKPSTDSNQSAERSKTESPSTSDSPKPDKSTKTINLSNISDWKVNDLKAELKKRNLPVSGSKMQLVERLKAAVATQKSSDPASEKPSIKMEVTDENSSEGMMDVGGEDTSKSKSTPSPSSTILIGSDNNNATVNNNIPILDLANGKLNGVPISLQHILDLLGISVSTGSENNITGSSNNPTDANNLKNSKVISQLPMSAVVASAKAAAAAAASNNESPKYIDENKILEQQNQILELQKALRISQQQLQQLSQQKDTKNGGPQKHRLVLQQHIQQKLQQQAIQNQLQNLIQLQAQQAEQKKQQQLLQQQQQQHQQATQQPQFVIISNGTNSAIHQIPQQTTTNPTNIASPVLTIPNTPVTIVNRPETNQHLKLENVQVERQQQQCLNNESSPMDQQQKAWTAPVHTTHTEKSLNFEDLVRPIHPKDIPKVEPVGENKGRNHGVKSQMVDDVLEILIRNGELPPSAAQDPHTKSGSSSPPSAVGNTAGNASRRSDAVAVVPPPPPPLPPPTFSVMLPTTIPFSRHQSQNSADFLGNGTVTRKDASLSKDAQEILRICEDLSNFGKSREAEAAAASKLEAGNKQQEHHANFHASSALNGNNTATMDCGFFTDSKDFDLADSMDVGFDDTHSVPSHATSTHTKNSHVPNDFQKHQFSNSSHQQQQQQPFGVMLNASDKLSNADGFVFGNSHPPQQYSSGSLSLKPHENHSHHHFMSDEELLPVSLDMQMDTDYSDWLDTLLPVNHHDSNTTSNNTSSVPTSANLFHVGDGDASKNISGKRQLVDHHQNNNLPTNASNSNSLFGSLLDEQPHHTVNTHQEQRDPLLSSRSFTRMPLPFGVEQPLLQQNNFLLAHHHLHNHTNASSLTNFHNPSSVVSTGTLMDTDFDELTTSLSKKSDSNNTEMPSTTAPSTAITTSSVSINDNFLWDFAM